MQNEGIKQGGLWPFLLRERSSMASGRILHLASTICQLGQKPSNYFSDPAPLVKQTLLLGNLYRLITASTCHSKSKQYRAQLLEKSIFTRPDWLHREPYQTIYPRLCNHRVPLLDEPCDQSHLTDHLWPDQVTYDQNQTWHCKKLDDGTIHDQPYLIFVTTITTGGCGEKICHVEKIFHMTDCHVEKISTWQIVMWKIISTW